jgi:hypothetical protein
MCESFNSEISRTRSLLGPLTAKHDRLKTEPGSISLFRYPYRGVSRLMIGPLLSEKNVLVAGNISAPIGSMSDEPEIPSGPNR